MVSKIFVKNGSGNGLLPGGTKPLPEPKLIYHQKYSAAFSSEHDMPMNLICNMFGNETLSKLLPHVLQANEFGLFGYQAFKKYLWIRQHFDGLVQDCSISITNALEILESCTKPSIYSIRSHKIFCPLKSQHMKPNKMAAILQTTFWNAFSWRKNHCILVQISLKSVPRDSTYNEPVLVQLMAWCKQATSHFLIQWWPRSRHH